jgi:hypothetical protein
VSMFLLPYVLAAAAVSESFPPVLQFSFYRMVSFKYRSEQLHCESRNLDKRLARVQKKLVKRYGKAFAWPKKQESVPSMGGDCYTLLMVYETNLRSFEQEAAAAF